MIENKNLPFPTIVQRVSEFTYLHQKRLKLLKFLQSDLRTIFCLI